MSTEKSIPAAARNHGGREKESRIIGMFSYGSNNQQQLRARVKSPALRGYPAHLDGYVRVFGSDSLSWGGGSVASVAPKEGGRVYGRFYCMTPQEVVILDLYEHVKEGNYLKEVRESENRPPPRPPRTHLSVGNPVAGVVCIRILQATCSCRHFRCAYSEVINVELRSNQA